MLRRLLALILSGPALALGAPGILGFGRGGVVVSTVASAVGGLAVQPGGRIVVGAGRQVGDGFGQAETLLVGFRPDGSLDPGFGNGGMVIGTLWNYPLPLPHVGLARFTPDLASDPAFGSGLITGPTGFTTDLVLQADGKAVVATALGEPGDERFALLRFTADGALDEGFGVHGVATAFADQRSRALRVVVQPDGKLVAAGVVGSNLVLARFLADGEHDPTTTTTTTPETASPSTTIASGATGTAAPATCATGCDDGYACTRDRCESTRCVHEDAVGFDAVTCRCAPAMPACASPAASAL